MAGKSDAHPPFPFDYQLRLAGNETCSNASCEELEEERKGEGRERLRRNYHGMSVLQITKQRNEIPEVPPGGCWLWIGSRLWPQMLSKGNKRREAHT